MIDFELFNAYLALIDHGDDCGCSLCQQHGAFIRDYPKDKFNYQNFIIKGELMRRATILKKETDK
jgi:hypothetical protein